MTAKHRYRLNAHNSAEQRFAQYDTITEVVPRKEWVCSAAKNAPAFNVAVLAQHVVLVGDAPINQVVRMFAFDDPEVVRNAMTRLKEWVALHPLHMPHVFAKRAAWAPRIFVPEMALEAADSLEDHFKRDPSPPHAGDPSDLHEAYWKRCIAREEQAAAMRLSIRERASGIDPYTYFQRSWRAIVRQDPPDVTDWDPAIIAQCEAIRVFVRLHATLQ